MKNFIYLFKSTFKKFLLFKYIFIFLISGCKKNSENDTLTDTQISSDVPGIYNGVVTNSYPGPVPYLIFNNIKITIKAANYGPGYLYSYPGLFSNVKLDTVRNDTSISNYWTIIDGFKLNGPRNNLIYKDSNRVYRLLINYNYDKNLIVIDYFNQLLKQDSHYYGTKISN